ncbi:acVLRF1 family peptidyl-tRNA hydrolase [Jatrophihabitans sp. YIM 134969]
MSTPDAAPPPGARHVVVGFDRLPRWLAGFGERHGAVETLSGPEVVALTGADGARAWIPVPFAPLHGALLDHVAVRRTVGVLLVRRGGYAVGVFDGRELVASKVDSTYVQGTTKAGGWSQQRFARRRANQAAALFGEAADVAVRILVGPRLDALVCGGDRPAVDAVLSDPRLTAVVARRTGPWLAGPDPRLKVLQQTPDRFLAVEITLDP